MKKNKFLIPIAALLVLGAGYFAFFYDKGEDPKPEPKEEKIVVADSVAAPSRPADPTKDEMHRLKLMSERTRPSEYIGLMVDPKKNILGESVIEGTITNKSEFSAYQEFELMIYWIDEEGTVLDSAAEVVFKSIEPGASAAFKTKRKGPKKGKSVLLSVKDAKVIER